MFKKLHYVDLHTAGEPVRIVTKGYPDLKGASILDKRREAKEKYDALRRAMNFEPRGHAGMYGVIPVKASHPEAALGVLFTHHEGYSTMCGHATIAIGRWMIDEGLIARTEPITRFAIEAPCGLLQLSVEIARTEPITRFAIEAPCGLLQLSVEIANHQVTRVTFESVPAFPFAQDLAIDVPHYGRIITDISYGGAFYCILPASRFGLDFFKTPVDTLVAAAGALTDAVRAKVKLTHPDANDLGFLYGTILTDDAEGSDETYNLCVFAERQIDRSPTGSGVTARMALDYAKGRIAKGQERIFRGISGEAFAGCVKGPVVYKVKDAVTVEVSGRSYYAGQGDFLIEDGDPLGHGFELAKCFDDIRKD